MTAQEERFEIFVNERQASHDISAEFEEWKRCRDVEKEAVTVFHEVGGDMNKYLRRMLTKDQAEMEFRCQRRREMERLLHGFWSQEQRRRRCWREAAAASQQERQQESLVSNQTVPSAEPGPPSQQVHQRTRSAEEIRLKFKEEVESRQRAQSNNNQALSSIQAGQSTQQGHTTARSHGVTPVTPDRQVQPASRPRTRDLFTAEEEEEFCREFLNFYPPIGKHMTFQAEWDREIASMARGNPGNLAIIFLGGWFYEVRIPAAGQTVRGEVGNAPGGRGQDVGSIEQWSTESSPRRPSSEEASSTPPSSQPSPDRLSNRPCIDGSFYGTDNVTVSDSRGLVNLSPERNDPDLKAMLRARLERVIDEEGEGRYAAH